MNKSEDIQDQNDQPQRRLKQDILVFKIQVKSVTIDDEIKFKNTFMNGFEKNYNKNLIKMMVFLINDKPEFSIPFIFEVKHFKRKKTLCEHAALVIHTYVGLILTFIKEESLIVVPKVASHNFRK